MLMLHHHSVKMSGGGGGSGLEATNKKRQRSPLKPALPSSGGGHDWVDCCMSCWTGMPVNDTANERVLTRSQCWSRGCSRCRHWAHQSQSPPPKAACAKVDQRTRQLSWHFWCSNHCRPCCGAHCKPCHQFFFADDRRALLHTVSRQQCWSSSGRPGGSSLRLQAHQRPAVISQRPAGTLRHMPRRSEPSRMDLVMQLNRQGLVARRLVCAAAWRQPWSRRRVQGGLAHRLRPPAARPLLRLHRSRSQTTGMCLPHSTICRLLPADAS